VREVQTRLWHWEAPHPEWEPGERWGPEVSSYAMDDGDRLLVFDPLALPSEIEELAASRETAIVLTCPWHRREAFSLAARFGAPIYVPPPDPSDLEPVPGHVFSAGDRLPVGVEAFPGREPNDLVLWVEGRRALVFGDTLMDRGDGLGLVFAAGPDEPTAQIREGLQPLLELPVELVLPTHGPPTDRATLVRALS
jgi:glyoxylase-like metal-dependent hydrolase (beta-lactamase superfamily II)